LRGPCSRRSGDPAPLCEQQRRPMDGHAEHHQLERVEPRWRNCPSLLWCQRIWVERGSTRGRAVRQSGGLCSGQLWGPDALDRRIGGRRAGAQRGHVAARRTGLPCGSPAFPQAELRRQSVRPLRRRVARAWAGCPAGRSVRREHSTAQLRSLLGRAARPPAVRTRNVGATAKNLKDCRSGWRIQAL